MFAYYIHIICARFIDIVFVTCIAVCSRTATRGAAAADGDGV
jgi:hypothetical protein